MPLDKVAFWERIFRKDIARRAEDVHTEDELDRWVKESQGWMTHLIDVESKRQAIGDAERKALADVCIAGFNDVYLQLCVRVYGDESFQVAAYG